MVAQALLTPEAGPALGQSRAHVLDLLRDAGVGRIVVNVHYLADQIEAHLSGRATDFDVAVATPEAMGEVRKLGKVLGPRGLMPNPKTGTVTDDTAKAVKEVKAGRVEFKVDKAGTYVVQLAVSDGVISVTANVAPRMMAEMCSAALVGDVKKARELNLRLIGLHQKLFIETNPVPVKAALATLGFAYEKRPRLSGGAYHPILRKVDAFLDRKLSGAAAERERRADVVLALGSRLGPFGVLPQYGFDYWPASAKIVGMRSSMATG